MEKNEILITGFTPFLTNKSNPSQDISEFLGRLGYPCQIIDVSYAAASKALEPEVLEKSGIKFVLSFGLAASRSCLSVEDTAYNQIDQKTKDNCGLIPINKTIDLSSPAFLKTTYETSKAKQAIEELNLPCQLSSDPGRYLCNYVYFLALKATKGHALFIHLPNPRPTISLKDMEQAALRVLEQIKTL